MKEIAWPRTLVCFLLITVSESQSPPDWIEDLSSVFDSGLSEALQIDTTLGTLSASGEAIEYTGGNEYFLVNPVTGKVTLDKLLDREAFTTIDVAFQATDKNDNSVATQYTVRVLDVNDNAPLFQGLPYTAAVAEDATGGQIVFSGITVRDADEGENAEVTMTCYIPQNDQEAAKACEMFEVVSYIESPGQYTGDIKLLQPLDYETKRSYALSLKVQDKGQPPRSSVVTVFLTIVDVQDSPPEFLQPQDSLLVYENTGQNESVGTIRAQDRDGRPNPLIIEIISDPQNYFRLGPVTADSSGVYSAALFTNGNVDRENLDGGDSYSLELQATELVNNQRTSAKVTKTVSVIIGDLNDNQPVFDNEVYTVSVPENLDAGFQVNDLNIFVEDKDLGNNAIFSIELLQGEDAAVFSVSPSSAAGSANVHLVVEEPRFLDYEKFAYRSHIFRIVAKETETPDQFSTTSTVTVLVTDLNDNTPRFLQNSYRFWIRENREVGYGIGQINATDPDSDFKDAITYKLTGQGSEWFTVSSTDGSIRLAEQLNYEEIKTIELQGYATDGGGNEATVPVIINVLDTNDQGPVFEHEHYGAFVVEDSTALNPPVTVKARDLENEEVTYRIVEGNTDDDAFVVGETTGVFSLRRNVNYKETDGKGFFAIVVEAKDDGSPPLTDRVTVTFTIRDQNDHTPVFVSSSYSGEVTEISDPGTFIVTVSAEDDDAGLNSQLGYVIHSGGRDNFKIDYTSGVISVANDADLDIDKFGTRYNLIVHAVDEGSPQMTGTAQAVITVLDANNKVPAFQQDSYFFSILESAVVNVTVGTVRASDPDTTQEIHYAINIDSITAKDNTGTDVISTETYDFKNIFYIDEISGTIRVKAALDRTYATEVTFQVEASDINAEDPIPQIGTAFVTVIVRSQDNDDITFDSPSADFVYLVEVPEEQKVPRQILQVGADDPVTGFSISDFEKVGSTDPNGYFSVDRTTGIVRLVKRLDYETLDPPELTFQVLAYTPAPDQRSATATVSLTVTDANDHSPKFDEDPYTFAVTESATDLTDIGRVTASDEDSGNFGSVTYSISGQGADLFTINETSGEVRVRKGEQLDREETSRYSLLVTATDTQGDDKSRSETVPLYIIIEDENDNNPKFSESEYRMVILEDKNPSSSVGQVTASDPDDGVNGEVTYSITGGNDDGVFIIEDRTGEIYTQESPSGPNRYELIVQATDTGGLSDETTVIVIVEQRGGRAPEGPVIEWPKNDIKNAILVSENATKGTEVVQIEMADPDQNYEYGFLANSDLDEDHQHFLIDPETGKITINKTLDRETKQTYRLAIEVKDNKKDTTGTVHYIYINVTDVDDNDVTFNCGQSPSILNSNQVAHVMEEKEPGEFVITVKACDADLDPKIFYRIIDGNDPIPAYGDQPPFSIDASTGTITTNVVLDREYRERHDITVKASSSPAQQTQDTGDRKKKETSPDELVVIVIVDDVDDNGISFAGYGSYLRESITTTQAKGSPFLTMRTEDVDGPAGPVKYSFSDFSFIGPRDNQTDVTPAPFTIEEETGVVRTTYDNYQKYANGYWTMTVNAKDDQAEQNIELRIYVVHPGQLVRFVLNSPPSEVAEIYNDILETLENSFAHADFRGDLRVRPHVNEDAQADDDKSDFCFHVFRREELMKSDEVIEMITDRLDDPEFYERLQYYTYYDIGYCTVKATTKRWEGYYYLWWILIVLALIIFIWALIILCCLYCLWPKYKKHVREKPYYASPSSYLILNDPMIAPSNISEKYPEYEWQEEVISVS